MKTTKIKIGNKASINLTRLLETRMLITANSGAGKSHTIRKILEEAYGKVQIIVLDLEGEFATLREKFDFLLIGKGGDINIDVRAAELLAKKLLELEASAIIDLYELKQYDRIMFVKYFLDSMINAPKELWHPCLVVVDEAHIFAPEKGHAESMNSVIDLMTRGRKRGFAGIIATQRLAKLHKDAAAEANNVLIGRTGLDVDMKRAAEILGFTSKQDMLSLRDLEPGEFYAFGTAISKSVEKIKVGEVQTTHPKSGQRIGIQKKPIPTEKVKNMLEKLVDLPEVAEKERMDKAELETEVRRLNYELRNIKFNQKPEADKESLDKAYRKGFFDAQEDYKKNAYEIKQKLKMLFNVGSFLQKISNESKEMEKIIMGLSDINLSPEIKPKIIVPISAPASEPAKIPKIPYSDGIKLREGAMKMLKAVAMFYPEPITKNQMAVMAGFSVKGGTFNTYLSELKKAGWLRENGEKIIISEEGIKSAGAVEPLPIDHNQIINMWASRFRAGAAKILKFIAEKYPYSTSKEQISAGTDFSHEGGTFNTYISELKRAGLIEIDESGEFKATKWLFLEK